jgi:hypothetical protein
VSGGVSNMPTGSFDRVRDGRFAKLNGAALAVRMRSSLNRGQNVTNSDIGCALDSRDDHNLLKRRYFKRVHDLFTNVRGRTD